MIPDSSPAQSRVSMMRQPKLARARRPHHLKGHLPAAWWDAQIEPQEPAALSFGVDHACDQYQRLLVRIEFQAIPRLELDPLFAVRRDPREQALFSDR